MEHKPWDYQAVWKERHGPVKLGLYRYCALLIGSTVVQYLNEEEAMLIKEYRALRRAVAAIEAERGRHQHT